MTEDETQHGKKWPGFALFVPAGLFIGMGIGWILGYMVPGLLIGLGIGFLVMAIHRARARAETPK